MLATGIIFGAGLSRVTRRVPPGERREIRRNRKWVGAIVLVSLAILLALGAVVIPDGRRVLDTVYLRYFAVIVGLSGLGFRFKSVVGAPLVLAVVALVLAVTVLIAGYVRPPASLGWVRPLSSNGETLVVEIEAPGEAPRVVRVTGRRMRLVAEAIDVHEYYAFVPSGARYRWAELQALPESQDGSATQVDVKRSYSLPGRSWLTALITRYPVGIREERVSTPVVTPELYRRYELRVTEAGALEVAAQSGS